MIRINELSLPLDHPPEALQQAILARLEIPAADLLKVTVFKRSYDARKKNSEIKFIYSLDLDVRNAAAKSIQRLRARERPPSGKT